ncbi:MAG: DUF3368 domain-containing protein [Acidobacteriaceae bacterium]|nr:DUF3368 domain-containing protein [Acidobacteriaceae bacterium]
MRVVVADTTPIRYLTSIGYLDLLPRLFENVLIPAVVYEELQHPATPQPVRAALKPTPTWLKVISTEVTDDPILQVLDEGERAALTLGLRLGADLILMDERKGAAVARRKGLPFTGTLGILILAAERQWLDLADTFARLRQTNFHYSEDLLQSLLLQHRRK